MVLGFLALALGVALDWQRLFPAFGDRVAALCALVVGQTLIAGTALGTWLNKGTDAFAAFVGRLAGEVDMKLAVVSTLVVGLCVGVLFLMWLLAFLPNVGFLRKHVGEPVSREMNSWLIWAGVLLPPLAGTVPGFWGEMATSSADTGAGFGETLVKVVLGG